MIKLGPQTEQALNKEFPDNWKSMAIMMNIPCEYIQEEKVLSINFSDTVYLDIHANNTFETNAQLQPTMIAQLIVDLAKQET